MHNEHVVIYHRAMMYHHDAVLKSFHVPDGQIARPWRAKARYHLHMVAIEVVRQLYPAQVTKIELPIVPW